MRVRLTPQALSRRRIAAKAPNGPTALAWSARQQEQKAESSVAAGEKGIGEIVRVNGNWTVDVRWLSDSSVGTGYPVGGQGGRNERAFHLQLAVSVRPQQPLRVSEERVKSICRQQMKASGRPGAYGTKFTRGACQVIL